MRIVIDLDGTICPIKEKGESYADLKPFDGAKERIRELKDAGHYIIINTARNMATCESNVGKVMKNVGKITLDWLDEHGIVYDEIFFGKPNGHVYIDDRALRFSGWDTVTQPLINEIAKER
ncbi:capsule biosynthesis phosphatase [Sporocytophaga myxococcoides]|uniref:Capsule biosynthesis phosphatase n=1 Tax=Sporocytophaga myxococcoides TaxID=153721 RepID=A0A098LB05_9BACT|nr:HAD hydrolase family protein [Sporocytophaga myxococcoides]GAL83343.1 capsule biosynthesis phosphatase [Sporocytophaga myxococcoides]